MKQLDTVTVVGVGLLGGSIGLALRERRLARHVIGVGRRESSLREAQNRGILDAWTTDLAAGVASSDLVVVCTPVEQIAEHVLQVAGACPAGTLITDVGSTKQRIVAAIGRRLARKSRSAKGRFVGSHPLAGSEKAGARFARADLFQDRAVIVTPTRQSAAADVQRLRQFWEGLGSRVLELSAADHDRALAATSHLPHLLASLLAAATPDEHLKLVANGWLDTTRIAGGDPELWRQIFAENRVHVLKSLAKFAKVLASFQRALKTDNQYQIRKLLEQGKQKRDAVGN